MLTILLLLSLQVSSIPLVNEDQPLILILGAGAAGVSTAKRLVELGHTNIKIIEASGRVGGRVLDMPLGDYSVEVGALWIQSLNTNQIYILSQKYNMTSVLADYEDYIIRDEQGRNVTEEADGPYELLEAAIERTMKNAKDLKANMKPDATKRAYFTQEGWRPRDPIDDVIEYFDHDFEYASPPAMCSTKFCDRGTYELHDSDEDNLVTDQRGYAYLLRSLLSEIVSENDKRLLFNQTVSLISYNDSKVVVHTQDNNTYVGDYVVVTFSLGVLQNKLVEFKPGLPIWKQEAINQKEMGCYMHIYFQFPRHFWDEDEYILYASNRRGYYPVWQNMNKSLPGSNILQVTNTGEECRRTQRLTDDEITEEVVSVLGKMYPNISIPQPIGSTTKRWQNDPLFMGSYSGWPSGYSLDTLKGLEAPIDQVYFAGEALVEGHDAFTHGGYYSGRKTADALYKCVTLGTCVTFKPLYDSRGCTYIDSSNYQKTAREDDGTCKFQCKPTSLSSINFQASDKIILNLLCALSVYIQL